MVAFEALGGVDDATECRRAFDADLLEFVPVAVERRLMRHARIERIAQCRILLRDVPAVHAAKRICHLSYGEVETLSNLNSNGFKSQSSLY